MLVEHGHGRGHDVLVGQGHGWLVKYGHGGGWKGARWGTAGQNRAGLRIEGGVEATIQGVSFVPKLGCWLL